MIISFQIIIHDTMKDTTRATLISAIIPTIGAFAIFFLGDFHRQSTLERDTVQVLSEKFDSVEKNMSYEDALQTIFNENESLKNERDKLNAQLINLNQEIKDKQTEIAKQNTAEEINKIIQNATDYWNNSDCIQSLLLLKNSKSKSTSIETLYEEYSKEYCNDVLLQAEQYISERNYDEAIKILSEGSSLINDNELLNNKIEEIKNKPSSLLSNLTPVSGEIESIWNAGKKDNYGNTYTSGICLQQQWNEAAHVVYSLDGKYTLLTGKFVLDDESKNTDGNYVLYAYSLTDGNMSLIGKSDVLSTATRPIDISFDVTNVVDLVLEVYDPAKLSGNARTGFVDAKLE